METLVEYLTYIKGLGYLLVVAFLFAFITFWLLVHTKNREIVKILQVIVVIWLAFGIASALVTKIRDKTATAGGLFLISAVFVVYMVYGLREYLKDQKHRIAVEIKPTEAMRAIARREAELKKEKEILYEEFWNKLT